MKKFIIGLCCAAAVFVSCNNAVDFVPENKTEIISESVKTEKAEKAYIRFSLKNNLSRTALPQEIKKEDFAYQLVGIKGEESKVLGSWETYAQMSQAFDTNIEIECGNWTFVLTAKKNGNDALTDTQEKTVAVGNNELNFDLKEVETGTGSVEITLQIPQNFYRKVTASLLTLDGNVVEGFESQELVIDEENSQAVYSKDNIPVGNYFVRFYIYQNSDDEDWCNVKTEYVHVAAENVSASEVVVSVNEVNAYYTIQYETGEFSFKDYVPSIYSIHENIELPTAQNFEQTVHLYGWYEKGDETKTYVTQISKGSTGIKTFVADIAWSVSSGEFKSFINTHSGERARVYISDANPDLSKIESGLNSTAGKNKKIDLDLSGCTDLTSIGNQAFWACSSLTSIVIPDSVTSIGDYAFGGCSSLTSIEIPDSVTSIGEDAFYECSSLTSVEIGNGVTSIPEGLLSGCSKLEELTIPFVGANKDASVANETTLFGYIFGTYSYTGGVKTEQYYSSGSSKRYYIPSTLKKVTVTGGDILCGAFYGCSRLTSIEIPDSVTSIGERAFYDCSSLTSIEIQDCVTSIGDYAFGGCSSLTSIEIPDSVTSIGEKAFYNCSSLTSIVIPNSVTSIPAGLLSCCSKLEEITIPFVGANKDASVADETTLFGYIFGTSIYTGGVEICQYYSSFSYRDYYIPSTLRKVTVTGGNILYGAFYNCRSLTSIEITDSVTSIGDSAFYNCSSLTSIDIPDGVTSIGWNAFRGCSSLTSIVIPDSVTSIGSYAFSGCSSLKRVGISDVNKWASIIFENSSSNPLYNTNHLYLNGVEVTDLVLDDSVKSIGAYAFVGCSSLTSIKIPDSVTSIGEYAFSGCSKLEELTIPFVGANKDASEAGRTTLFGYIFGSSSYTGGVKTKQYYSSGSNNFYEYYYIPSTLKKVTVTGGNILYGAFYGCESLTSIVLGDGVTSIGEYAFYNCSSLTSIVLEDGVTSIGKYAFYNCSSLTSIEIGNGVTSIGSYAFSGCSSFTSIIIPDSVTSIGEYAFYGFSGLTSIIIPDSVTSIGSSAFYDCSSLASINIPDSVTSIGSSAFRGCSGLTSINIPDSVTSIGEYAFSGCSKLEEITIPFVGANKDASVADETTLFGYIFGTISYTGGVEIRQGYSSTTHVSYCIPSTLRKVTVTGGNILYGAFYNCRSLTSIEITDSVTSIGESAFYNCSSLTSIDIPDGVTSIGWNAFSGCSGLTSINIPDGVTEIGLYAFYNCSSLISIEIPDSVTWIGGEAFYGIETVYYNGTATGRPWGADQVLRY